MDQACLFELWNYGCFSGFREAALPIGDYTRDRSTGVMARYRQQSRTKSGARDK